VSSGCACTSRVLEPSHVLLAIGKKHEEAHGSILFKISRYHNMEDVDYTIEQLSNVKNGHVSHNVCPLCIPEHRTKWYKESLFIAVLIVLVILTVNYILEFLGYPVLHNFVISFYNYVSMIWFPILLGILIGGLIDYFVPREYIMKVLAQHNKRTILYSVVLGFLVSACSHGILAISMELYRKGASTPAIIAFLLAAPWANLSITIILFGLFGIRAVFFIASALIIAIITGLIYLGFDKRGLVECANHTVHAHTHVGHSVHSTITCKVILHQHSTTKKIKEAGVGVLKGSWELSKMILWWMIIGMVLASLARAYVPKEFFVNFMGPSIVGLIVTLLLATVLEVCSEGTAPLAFEIFRQTGAFGNSFVFLMAGVATDYTEMGLIWHNIGKRAAIYLPLLTVPQIIVIGYLFNLLL